MCIFSFSMRRFLLQVLFLTAVATVALLANDCVLYSFHRMRPNDLALRLDKLLNRLPESEIPILGSSRALQQFWPSLISSRCYNYGVNGADLRETIMQLRRILTMRSPEAVIVNVDPWGVTSSDRQEAEWRGDYSIAGIDPITRDLFKLDAVDWMPGLRFWGKFKIIANEWYCNRNMESAKVVDNGSEISRGVQKADYFKTVARRIGDQLFNMPNEVEDELLSTIKGNVQVRFYLVVAPIHRLWLGKYKGNAGLNEFLERVRTCENVICVDLLEMSSRLDDEDFRDLTHLNENGARKFSEQVSVAVKGLNEL